MCAGALVQFRVTTLVYGALIQKPVAIDSVIDVVRQPRFNHQVQVIAGVLEDECRSILQRFFRELRKKKIIGEMAELDEGARLEIE